MRKAIVVVQVNIIASGTGEKPSPAKSGPGTDDTHIQGNDDETRQTEPADPQNTVLTHVPTMDESLFAAVTQLRQNDGPLLLLSEPSSLAMAEHAMDTTTAMDDESLHGQGVQRRGHATEEVGTNDVASMIRVDGAAGMFRHFDQDTASQSDSKSAMLTHHQQEGLAASPAASPDDQSESIFLFEGITRDWVGRGP